MIVDKTSCFKQKTSDRGNIFPTEYKVKNSKISKAVAKLKSQTKF